MLDMTGEKFENKFSNIEISARRGGHVGVKMELIHRIIMVFLPGNFLVTVAAEKVSLIVILILVIIIAILLLTLRRVGKEVCPSVHCLEKSMAKNERMPQDRDADTGRNMTEEALEALQIVFHKILKVNLTQDCYWEIKTYEEERCADKGYCPEISGWLAEFAKSGQVFEEDRAEYLAFTKLARIKDRLSSGEKYQTLRYRRRVGGEFRWVQMEIVAGAEYSEEEQIVFLYVRDIHDSCLADQEYLKELEKCSHTDALTGLYNRHYMAKYCQNYLASDQENVGVIFCDLNGLKYTNDHYGHLEGDRLILRFADILAKSFPEDMCCRMSGDEFVVCALGKTRAEFVSRVELFRKNSTSDGVPLSAVGCCWSTGTDNIRSMISKAENAMYKDKKKFYEEFPLYRR